MLVAHVVTVTEKVVTEYIYTQAVVQFRTPINSDGTLGKPEIVKRFVSPFKGAQSMVKKAKPKPKKEKVTLKAERRETLEI